MRAHRSRWREAIVGAAALAMIAAVGAVASYWTNRELPAVRLALADLNEIAAGDVLKLEPEDVLWVDARFEKDYEAGHLPRAVCFNEANWEAQTSALVFGWRPGKRVVVYGKDARATRRMASIIAVIIGLGDVVFCRGDWEELATAFGREGGER